MRSFSSFVKTKRLMLSEGVSIKNFLAANRLIIQYLNRKLNGIHRLPGVEIFKNSAGKGYGFRFFTNDGKSFRFNWITTDATADPVSIDIWTGGQRDPNYRINTDGVSLAQVLPYIAQMIRAPKLGDFTIIVADAVNEGQGEDDDLRLLLEAKAGMDPEYVLDELMPLFTSGNAFSAHQITKIGRTTGDRIWRQVLKLYPDAFDVEQSGARQFFTYNNSTELNSQQILGSLATATLSVGRGPAGETYSSAAIRDAEEQAKADNKVPYDVALEDLKKLISAVVKGVSNALFVGGVGGTGKCLDPNTLVDVDLSENLYNYLKEKGDIVDEGDQQS